MTGFERDTAVTPAGDGRYAARCEPAWYGGTGPHGGYLGAIVVRAMQARLAADGASERALRSITLHYLRPPAEGDVDVEVVVERTGRSLSTLSARMSQGGRTCVLALAALAVDFPAPERARYDSPMPEAPPPEDAPVIPREVSPPMARHFELRPCLGPLPFSGADEPRSGGWIAFADREQPYDAAALVMICDVWLPSPWTRFDRFVPALTIDLTVHLRAPDVAPAAPLLGVFESRAGRGGFFDESGELWSRDGVLVAQSRQLALLRA
ncbi:MAG TPA: thioesterase family protein [Solirubrobacteraceae bacterium]|nr:thioesterase family protein [Solirubrobacteraceae bacterium]